MCIWCGITEIRKILESLKLPAEPPKIALAQAPPQASLHFDDTV
jgi:hypothetical protein